MLFTFGFLGLGAGCALALMALRSARRRVLLERLSGTMFLLGLLVLGVGLTLHYGGGE